MCESLAVDSRESAGAPEKIEITPAMIEAGAGAFYREMVVRDYLAVAPTQEGLARALSDVFYVMYSNMPSRRAK